MKNKLPDEKNVDDKEYSLEPTDEDDPYARELSLKPTTADKPKKIPEAPRPKTFHSRRAIPDEENFSTPKRKRKLSHAETSGVVISIVMLIYSLAEQDKPLFFVSTALVIFLLRPLIGALFGKHSQAVQNALHSFSIVMFIGALLFLFLQT